LTYVPNAVASGDGLQNLQPLGLAGQATHFTLVPSAVDGKDRAVSATSVTLFDQGLSQVVQAAVTGLRPAQEYVLALSTRPDGSGTLQALAMFKANAAGAAIVTTVGPIRQIVQNTAMTEKRYLVIAPGNATQYGAPVQIQSF
jgi:hypothetical protein